MSLETDCGPRRVDSAGRSHIQTVRFVADRISCEKMYQSCSGHGKNPFHWHLQRGEGGEGGLVGQTGRSLTDCPTIHTTTAA